MNIINHAKTSLLEYFNQVGSILSMWIGFAVYPSYLQFASFVEKCFRAITNRQRDTSTALEVETSFGLEKRESRSVRKLNDLFMRVLCWLVTVYYVVEISLIYLERPFNICIIAEVPITIKMLGVSVCLDMVIHPDKVQQLYPDVYENITHDRWKEVFSIEQLFETTTEWKEVFDIDSDYQMPDGEYNFMNNTFNATKSITGHYTCFTTLRQQEYLLPGILKDHLRAAVSTGENMCLMLDNEMLYQLNQSLVRVHFHHDGPISEEDSASNVLLIVLESDPKLYANEIAIRTYRTEVKFFPDHIKSICWDYEKKFGFKRQVVFDKCVLSHFTRKYNIWPSGYQAWESGRASEAYLMEGLDLKALRMSNLSMQEKLDRV